MFNNRLPVNHNYFSSVDSEEKAYWLGHITADGCVSDSGYITLALIDYEHIQKWKEVLQNEHKIAVNRKVMKGKTFYTHRLVFRSKQMAFDLARYGVVPRKSTKETVPDLPEHLMSHWWRGEFDGDGYLGWDNRYNIPLAGICGSFEVANRFSELVNTKTESSTNPCPRGNIFIANSSRKSAIGILDYLYENSTHNTRLNRKYNKYIEFKENYSLIRKLVQDKRDSVLSDVSNNMGVKNIATKYNVTETTARQWRRGLHLPDEG